MEDKDIITCEECVYSFDEVKSPDNVHCCKHKKSVFHLDTCDDARDI